MTGRVTRKKREEHVGGNRCLCSGRMPHLGWIFISLLLSFVVVKLFFFLLSFETKNVSGKWCEYMSHDIY